MALRNPFRFDDQHPFTGRHMLAIVVLFFGVTVTVNLVMAFMATGTFPGLVVENSYVASQHYNDYLREARAQQQTGPKMQMAFGDGLVSVRFVGADGEPMRGLAVTALIGRPSSTAEDRHIDLVAAGGDYRAAEPLPPGNWLVDVEAFQGDARLYREQQRIYVRPG